LFRGGAKEGRKNASCLNRPTSLAVFKEVIGEVVKLRERKISKLVERKASTLHR